MSKFDNDEMEKKFEEVVNKDQQEVTVYGIITRIDYNLLKESDPIAMTQEYLNWLDSVSSIDIERDKEFTELSNESDTYTDDPIECEGCELIFDSDDIESDYCEDCTKENLNQAEV